MNRLEQIAGECVSKLLRESNFNYHVSKYPITDWHPYASEGKAVKNQGAGHFTGDFGSGTYFVSEYSNEGFDWSKSDYSDRSTPEFIKVGGAMYRVDFDIYRNLYTVKSQRVADMLYTTLKYVNTFYNRITKGHTDVSVPYQIIKRNSEVLGLDCPSFMQLYRMVQEHHADDSRHQSFSTVFMEWNGYNGVNVSGVPMYDNTRHGSVIYDLSKVSDKIKPVKVDYNRIPFRTSETDTVARSIGDWAEFQDAEMASLSSVGDFNAYYLDKVEPSKRMRLLKNAAMNGKILDVKDIKYRLEPELAKRYLMYLFANRDKITNFFGDRIVYRLASDYDFGDAIMKNNALYWCRLKDDPDQGFKHINLFSSILSDIYYDMPYGGRSKEKAVHIIGKELGRDFNEEEREYIDYFLNRNM